jgi:tRNA (guanine37-N1)-methyltransferase
VSDAAPTPALRATIVSLFPESLHGVWQASILGRATRAGTLVVDDVQIRDFAEDKHRTVDDTPAGGGPGMIMRADVVERALQAASAAHAGREQRTLLLDAAGSRFDNEAAERLAGYEHLVLLCGRYEGVDARVHDLVDEVLCVGDFVLTGGELAAAIVVDAVARHVPGVLGNASSADDESHRRGLLEHRQYTRPIAHGGASGDHARIARARRKDALARTRQARPDLWERYSATADDERLLRDDGVPTLEPTREASPAETGGEA